MFIEGTGQVVEQTARAAEVTGTVDQSAVGQERDNLKHLVLAVQKLSLARSVQEIADIVKVTARALTQADGATFVLRDHGQCYYFEEDAIGPLWKGQRFPMSICVSGWAMMNARAAIIPDITKDERVPLAAYEPTFVRSLVMVPVRTLDPIAAIGIYWSQPHPATDAEVGLLQALADSTSIALENVQVYAELEERVLLRTGELRAANDELRRSNEKLQAAHDKILDLEKLVRMCAWTNRLEFNGEWLSIEEYLERQFGVQVSHGISKEAIAHLQVELAARKAKMAA